MPSIKQIVYLSKAQYEELVSNESITVDGVTITYNENDIYITPQDNPVTDVKINGVSITGNGIANIPIADNLGSRLGVVSAKSSNGILINSAGLITLSPCNESKAKGGTNNQFAIVPSIQHASAFYGLAKAAGADMASSSNAVGTYTDSAKSAIQSMLGVSQMLAPVESDTTADRAYAIGEIFSYNGKLYQATDAIAQDGNINPGINCQEVTIVSALPHDVQVNGTSVVSNGVANVPIASSSTLGVVKVSSAYGISVDNGLLKLQTASIQACKQQVGSTGYQNLTVFNQHAAAFYGLATASGDTTQSASSNAVGTYTDEAKAAIKAMLGVVDGSTGTVDVSGTTPTISAIENTRYICGEVSTLTVTPALSGVSIIRFTSGTTPTVLTATGVTWPEWFDANNLEADTVYEICITDGEYGAVMTWPL